MKTAVAFALAYAGIVAGQLGNLPACATTCVDGFFTGGSGYAGCGTNANCICANSGFIGSVACCLATACDTADQSSAVTFAQQICQANGVTVPSAVSCPSTAAPATASASTTAAGTTSGSNTGSASAPASTGSGSGSSAPAASTGSASASAAASTSKNFAAMPQPTAAAFGALGGGLLAMAALL